MPGACGPEMYARGVWGAAESPGSEMPGKERPGNEPPEKEAGRKPFRDQRGLEPGRFALLALGRSRGTWGTWGAWGAWGAWGIGGGPNGPIAPADPPRGGCEGETFPGAPGAGHWTARCPGVP